VYPSVEPGKVDIDPIVVFRTLIEKKRVLHDFPINGIFKRIREVRFAEQLIFFGRKFDLEITAGFGNIFTIACPGSYGYQGYENAK
jgi:hypothetical protein